MTRHRRNLAIANFQFYDNAAGPLFSDPAALLSLTPVASEFCEGNVAQGTHSEVAKPSRRYVRQRLPLEFEVLSMEAGASGPAKSHRQQEPIRTNTADDSSDPAA